ncbi:MAG: DUF1330 domain-containing protein [Fibrobacteria bacterium]
MVHLDITDPEKFKEYLAANGVPLKKYGAHFLARAGRFQHPEGGGRSRNTIIEFPSFDAALECWKSEEYQYAISLRKEASSIDITIVEGYDGPQLA